MSPKQKAMIVAALELAADKAQDAMLHAQTALIDLKYGDPEGACERTKLVFLATSEAQHAATRAGAWLDYVIHSTGDEN